mgnify:CR=1 FL=1
MYFIVPAIFAALNVLLIGVCFYLKNVTSKKLKRELEQIKSDIASEHRKLAYDKVRYEESLKN